MTGSVCLYSILGVEKDATPKQITRAFRLRAIQLHPDKKKPEERDSATQHFQALQAAYDILGNTEKRRHYDKTGEIVHDLEDIVSKWEGCYPPITLDLIQDYEKRYRGSSEEEEDLRHFFTLFKGDVVNLLEYIPFSEPQDVERYIEKIQTMLENHTLRSTKQMEEKFHHAQITLRRRAKVYAERIKRERKELASQNKSLTDQESYGALVSLIQKNKKLREGNSFLDELEKKYVKKTKKTKHVKK